PATGSAVASLAGALMKYEKFSNGSHSFLVEQGYEMGRASDIMLEIDVEDGEFFAARIGGAAVVVADGTLYL
ncbi:MAG: PhzF family phenazine biosynthesis protein, partial [Pseudomonadota bacterium]